MWRADNNLLIQAKHKVITTGTVNAILTSYHKIFIYTPTDAIVLKIILKFALKFTLKQLRHVSVLQLHYHQKAH